MSDQSKKNIGVLCAVILIAVATWLFFFSETPTLEGPQIVPVEEVPIPEAVVETIKIIGYSVEGRAIESYTYGTGSTTLLFVGGVHGGYEWNSTLLAYDFIDSLETKTVLVPENISVVVIPTLNPDGLFSVVGKEGRFTVAEIPPNDAHTTGRGRFNANDVDLNRNFDCKWSPQSTWRGKIVSAGTSAFSEPEAQVLRNTVVEKSPAAVIFWHSQANAVYASECEEGILEDTLTLMNTYAANGNYTPVSVFDAYPITGDAEGWLASIGIPAITVELETRTSSEWERNRKAIEAVLRTYTIAP